MSVYLLAKNVHVSCVALSIAGFVTRFALAQRRADILQLRLVRVAPHVNDTILLGAAITMLAVAQWKLLDMPWLGAKIAGLVVYIACGAMALRRGRTRRGRMAAFVAALAAFGYVVSVALSKSVAGPFVRFVT